MTDDTELLRCYAEENSEEAFAELVRRRIGLVYSVAWRHTRDAQRAEDVTQAVFTALARKAGDLARRPVLVGWLYRSAQFAASDAVRAEVRRQAREQEAHIMNECEREAPEPDWPALRPVLDEGLNALEERDRDAVLLRFFDGQSFAEIGTNLNLTENAARMRVERALGKLHAVLARRGVKSTAAALGVALGGQAGVAAPAGLAASVTGGALGGVAGGAGWLAAFMGINKIQLGIAAVVVAVGVTGYVVQAETQDGLRREIAALQGQPAALAELRAENRRLAARAAEVEMLRRDDGEFRRLGQEVEVAKKAGEEAAKRARGARQKADMEDLQAMMERIRRETGPLREELKALINRSNDPALTGEERTALKAAVVAKDKELQAKLLEIRARPEHAGIGGLRPVPTTP